MAVPTAWRFLAADPDDSFHLAADAFETGDGAALAVDEFVLLLPA